MLREGLRILSITNDFPTGSMPGNAPCIRDQITALTKSGHKVDLLFIDTKKGKHRAYLIAALRIFLLNFTRKRYDLIHAYYGHCGILARLQFVCPILLTFRGSDLLSRKDGMIGKLAARLVDGVIVMSKQMAEVSKRKDAVIIPFGVNLTVFRPYPKEIARRDLKLSLDDKLILFPWNPQRPEKRFDVVKEAVDRLNTGREQCRLIVLFGKPHELVAKYMNACDVMVLASDYEGSPVAVREAIACNLPIVSVNVGDVRQMISGIENCVVCEQKSNDIAEKIRMILSKKTRANGSAVISGMEAERSAAKVISVYNSILGHKT